MTAILQAAEHLQGAITLLEQRVERRVSESKTRLDAALAEKEDLFRALEEARQGVEKLAQEKAALQAENAALKAENATIQRNREKAGQRLDAVIEQLSISLDEPAKEEGAENASV